MEQRGQVIYDERIPRLIEGPKPRKTNQRMVMLLLLFFLLIMLIIYFQSPLARLSSIELNGNFLIDADELLKRANLEIGMPFLALSKGDIQQELEQFLEIESVRVEKIFPNKLKISIEEYPIVSFWLEKNQLYPVISSGHILMNRPWKEQVNHPILSHWPTKDGLGELASELNKLSLAVRNRISEIRLTPLVSDPYRLVLYMNDGYEVRTSIRNFAENMAWYPHYVQLAQEEGAFEGIFYLLEGKWYINPNQQESGQGERDE